MEEFLRVMLARILPEACGFEVHSFRGKSGLLKNLAPRLRGYARWLPDDWRIFVVVDRDNDDCLDLKRELEEASEAAGLRTRSRAGDDNWQVVNRIVVEELEAWYFGDWHAVRSAFPRRVGTRTGTGKIPRSRCHQRNLGSLRTHFAIAWILCHRPAQNRSRKGDRRPYRTEPQPFRKLQYISCRGR